MDNLTGRSVLITNMGIGPGPAIVAELTRRGARVAIQHTYDDKVANETATKISGLTGREHEIVQADLRHVFECDRAVEEAAEALDGLDVLVNNAGVVRPRGFLDTDEAVYNEVFDLNVSCIHGHGGLPPRAAYAAAEGAVIAITRELSMEWRDKGIRVNAVAPGLIEEPRDFDIAGSTTEFGNTLVPAGKLGHPSYIALVVAFLASDDVDFTGQVL